MSESGALDKTLGPVMLWGLGVGYVISGEYFGWNLGLIHGGPYGMLAATIMVTIMYICFVLSYAEISCAIPRAGGAFVYASRAFGPGIGFLAGFSQLVEFVIAPSAIAYAIGSYFQIFMPDFPIIVTAMIAYVIFTSLNIFGVKMAAIFELGITILAVVELLIFAGMTIPSFSVEAFSQNPLPNGWGGIFPALPFAIWFYLAIEGLANVAEETKNPQKNLIRGFAAAMFTLTFLAILTFFAATGVGGWEAIVYDEAGNVSDNPLPMALKLVVGEGSMLHLLVTIGLFGLIASFHGIILAAGRATFEFGRVGYFPKWLGKIHETRKTPWAALIANMLVGFIALATGRTGDLITMSVIGALVLYIISMLSLFKLRRDEPHLHRPFKVPIYPVLPLIALVLATICLASVVYYNFLLAGLFLGALALAYAYFYLIVPAEIRVNPFKPELEETPEETPEESA